MTRFYILATGPSINSITDREWNYIQSNNNIGISHITMLGKKLKYYYSHEELYDDKINLNKLAKDNYLDTYLFLYNNKSIKLARNLGFKHVYKINKGRYNPTNWSDKTKLPNYSYLDVMAKSLNDPIYRPKGQLGAAINIAILLGGTDIRLCGVDLDSQYHFYDKFEEFKQLTEYQREIEWKKHSNIKNWDKENIHSTVIKGDVGIIEILNWMRISLDEIDIKLSCCNKNSLVVKNNSLPYVSIMEEI